MSMQHARLHALRPENAVRDLRHVVEHNKLRRPVVFTKTPDVWLVHAEESTNIVVQWCTRRPGPNRIPVDPTGMLISIQAAMLEHDAIVVDAFPEGLSGSSITRWLLELDDVLSERSSPVTMVVVDPSLHEPHVVEQWLTLAPWLHEHVDERTVIPDSLGYEWTTDETRSTVTEDQTEGVKHLTQLPPGFGVDALRRRLLQWRRMGFDVSDLEPALDANQSRMEALYRDVEARVRTAVDLERRLDACALYLDPVHLERDRFRLRQLTGFSDIESRLNILEESLRR